jgi:hypothetical protein
MWAGLVSAQVYLGDGITLGAKANVSTGYSGNYGNETPSTHSLDLSGAADFNGSYFSPNFLAFSAQTFYGQSRANSDIQSVFDSSGVNASATIFGGSKIFPGSINFSKTIDSQGTSAAPGGLPGYTTKGSGQSFGVAWGLNLPAMPKIAVNFQDSSSDYSVFGSSQNGDASSRGFGIQGNDRVFGFNLNGVYARSWTNSETPLVYSGGGMSQATADSQSEGFGISHSLPLEGTINAAYSGNSGSYQFLGGAGGDQATGVWTASAGFHPLAKLTTSVSAEYNDNLGGSLRQAILGAGGFVDSEKLGKSSATSVVGTASYALFDSILVSGQLQRRDQQYGGMSAGATSYGVSANYARRLGSGYIGTSSMVSQYFTDGSAESTLGFSQSLSYSRQLLGWAVALSGGYSQNNQTALISYMSSSYSYGGSIGRPIKSLNWSLNASGSHSGLSAQPGTMNSSESYSTAISMRRWFSGNATYHQASGQAIQTISGLATSPIPSPIVNPGQLITYASRAYSFAVSSSPVKRFAITAAFSKALSNTQSLTGPVSFQTDQLTVTTHYQFRKMYINGGYTKFRQGVSDSGRPPNESSTFFIGLSRWFNFL